MGAYQFFFFDSNGVRGEDHDGMVRIDWFSDSDIQTLDIQVLLMTQ